MNTGKSLATLQWPAGIPNMSSDPEPATDSFKGGSYEVQLGLAHVIKNNPRWGCGNSGGDKLTQCTL